MAFHVSSVDFACSALSVTSSNKHLTFNCYTIIQKSDHNFLDILSFLVIVVLMFHLPFTFVLARHNPIYSTYVVRIVFSLVVCDGIFLTPL